MSALQRRPRCWAVIPAAGRGERMSAGIPKQYLRLAGATVIEHALHPFVEHPDIAAVVVALSADDVHWAQLKIAAHGDELVRVVGGAQRMHSVSNGLEALISRADDDDWVLVHDAARPCLTRADLDRLMGALRADPVGGLLALPLSDTIKRSDADGRIAATIDRRGLWAAQTPQMFRFATLRRALAAALSRGDVLTDEAAAIEALGFVPRLVEGPAANVKVTRGEDLALAEAILAGQISQGGRAMVQRVGMGYDVHAFTSGDHVMLGGVRVPHDQGVRAHSDGDVIIHALCDALLGAAGLGDIGQHFPDSDARWRGASSRMFLQEVMSLLARDGYRVVNADVTLVAEAPRLGAHRQTIRQTLAELLRADAAAVNVKATTQEGLGALGRREGLAAQAIVTIARPSAGG